MELLSRLQDDELPAGEMNPFCFAEPLAPLVAARKRRQRIDQGDVLARIQRVQSRCECLLIEGSGGLMVPLGEGFFVADVIAALDCDVVVVAQNKLGVINHTLLTSRVLALHGVRRMKIALLARRRADLSARTNSKILAELLAPIRVINLPFLGVGANRADVLKKKHKKLKKTLAEICNFATFCPAL